MKSYFYAVKLLQKLFVFYINSSLHVSLAVCALVAITSMRFEFEQDWRLLLFVFFATITGYNFTKYAPLAKLHHRSLTASLRLIQLFSLGCFVAMCYFAMELSLKELLITTPFLLLTLAYAIPVSSGYKTLRTLPGLKIVVIAVCWSGITVLLPAIHYNILLDSTMLIVGVQRLLFIIAITIPFEIRDLHYDSAALRTLPQVVGVQQSKNIGVFLVMLSCAMLLIQEQVAMQETVSTIVITALVILFVIRSNKAQSVNYCAFWVEGLPIMWMFIVFLCHKLL